MCAAYGAQLCFYGAGFVLCMELWGTAVYLWGVLCIVRHLWGTACIYGARFVLCVELWGTAVLLWGAVCAVCRLWGTAVHLWGTVCVVQHL